MIKSNFSSFYKDLKKETDQKLVKLEENATEIVLTAYNEIQRLSPVDQGTYRASHFTTKNQRTNAIGEPNQEGQRISETNSILSQNVKGGDKIFIQNNLPYAVALENGTSKQAPNGVYGIVEERTKRRIQKERKETV